MAELKEFAEQLVNLTVKEVNELAEILKEEYGIEPAAAAAVAIAGPGLASAPAPAPPPSGTTDVLSAYPVRHAAVARHPSFSLSCAPRTGPLWPCA